jgi:hypothetical protein
MRTSHKELFNVLPQPPTIPFLVGERFWEFGAVDNAEDGIWLLP